MILVLLLSYFVVPLGHVGLYESVPNQASKNTLNYSSVTHPSEADFTVLMYL